METFTQAPHADVLALLVQVALLLLAARGLGEAAQRLGQPAVVGEILAGILLGPSLLSALLPGLGEWIVPRTALRGHLLEVVSLFGAMFLLLITGLETDLTLIRRHARTAIGVSAGGVLVTFGSGFLLGQSLPDDLLANPGQRLVFSLFVATAMSISAIPVIAKVLFDLNLVRRDIGQTIIASGMSDDTSGWILLSIIAGLAGGDAVTAASVAAAVATVLAFLAVSFTLGRWLVKRAVDWVQDEMVSADRLLTLSIVLTFAWAALTHALRLEPVLGAFVMGILLGQMPRLPEAVRRSLHSLALAIFAPVFFAVAGLKVDVTRLLEPRLALIALLVIGVASAGKIVGTYAGARLIGRRDHWTALSFGAGLNARGAMEIIVASIGLSLGILTREMFSIIVVMAMVTSLAAPFALRRVLRHVTPAEEELARLRQEKAAAGSRIAAIHRVLLPVRHRPGDPGATQTIEATILGKMASKARLSITLLSVSDGEEPARVARFLDSLGARFAPAEVQKKIASGRSVADAILDEAQKGYDLVLLGAPDRRGTERTLFTPLVDFVVRDAPCVTMVVQGRGLREEWSPRRILVPTNGSQAAKHAAELGYALVSSGNEEVTLLHVVRQERGLWRYGERSAQLERQVAIGRQIVEELRQIGTSLGVHANGEVRVGAEPERVIADVARRTGVDLIILGTDLRVGSDRIFFGPRVERILDDAPCPVIVLNAP